MNNIIMQLCSPGSPFSKDLGLLFLRLGFGLLCLKYGFYHLKAGKQTWHWLGAQIDFLGITFMPICWGFVAAATEFWGGLCCIIGFKTRFATAFLSVIMFIALIMHVRKKDNFNNICLPLTFLIALISIGIAGAGRFSIDYLLIKMWC